MGIFDIFKKKKKQENINVEDLCHKALPQFYESPEGKMIGVFTLTEDTETLMAANPKKYYAEQTNDSIEYVLMLCSTTKDAIIGELEFYQAKEKLKDYIRAENESAMFIRGLTLAEMEALLK